MCFMISIEDPLLCDVGVDLRAREIPVALEFLDTPKVGSAIQQVGRKTVPQGVRTCGVDQAGSPQMTL